MKVNTTELGLENLDPYQKREFVPGDTNLRDVKEVKFLYRQLIERKIHSSEELEKWILDRSELESAVNQVESILHIKMTSQTDDSSRAKAYQDFIKTVEPAVKPLEDQLNHKYLKEIKRFTLDQKRYEVYNREIRADVELFVPENVDLQTQLQLLSQEYQAICGAMTVEFQGQERTLQEMNKFLLEPDFRLREQAWRLMTQRRLKDKEKLEDVFDHMVSLRKTVAKNAQYANYCEYKFRELHRFDYTPEDCKKYHESIEHLVVPIYQKILDERKILMKVDRLRPWDISVDPLGRPALKPFEQVEELINGCTDIFNRVDKDLGAQFSEMAEKRLLDLSSRKGKAPGGYQEMLNEARKPFIFMNAVGIDDDVRTLLHEGGHAFHALSCAHDPLLDYRHGPMEFNEVASMGMELLAGKYLSVFYDEEDEKRSNIDHLKDIIYLLIWVAIIDSFQHWIYENPTHSVNDRKQMWLKIHKRFGGDCVDWEGLEMERAFLWHRQLHIFEVPFYYIEYGIAQLGALQLWSNAQKDWAKALSDFHRGLSLGGSRPLPILYQEAGIRFDFSRETIAPLMEALKQEIEKY